jgi:hypothetical protein
MSDQHDQRGKRDQRSRDRRRGQRVVEARNMFARPFDSAIVAERALWSTKCSVVTNVIAADGGLAPSLAS